MQNRRQFIGATALAAIPAALALEEGLVSAQGGARAETTEERVLRQIATENARAYNNAVRHGSRGEHYRTAASGLRVFAALGVDDQFRRLARQYARAHGRTIAGMRHLDHANMYRELRKLGMTVSPGELDRLRLTFEPTPAVIQEVLAPAFSASAHFRQLAQLLEQSGEEVARLEAAPGIRRVIRAVECDKYTYELQVTQFLVLVLCLSGNVPGCLAAETSVLLISTALYAAGC